MAYSQAVADEICAKLSAGMSLRAICREAGMPAESTVRLWVVDDVQGFAAQYARARDVGYESMAEEIIEISDDLSGDVILTENGSRMDAEFVARSKLRVDARKWLLSKMLPKKYGDKLAIGGADDLPPIKTMSDEALAARIKALQSKVSGGGDKS